MNSIFSELHNEHIWSCFKLLLIFHCSGFPKLVLFVSFSGFYLKLICNIRLNWLVWRTWLLTMWTMWTAGIDGHYWSHRTHTTSFVLFVCDDLFWCQLKRLFHIFSLTCNGVVLISLLPPQYNEGEWTIQNTESSVFSWNYDFGQNVPMKTVYSENYG